MKKGLTTLLVILLALGAVLVSCKAEVAAPADELVAVSFEEASSRALSATLEDFNKADFYWYYAAAKTDSTGLLSGQTETYDFAGAVPVSAGNKGLAGYTVPGFSQGTWKFKLFAYFADPTTEAEKEAWVYSGEATAVVLKKGGTNQVTVTVSPNQQGEGILFVDKENISLAEYTPLLSANQVAPVITIEAIQGGEATVVPGTNVKYTAPAGTYRVTVAYTDGFITYATGSVIATVYPSLTTTVTGTVDELVTYAQFEAEQNPDIITRTAGSMEDVTLTTSEPVDLVDTETASPKVSASVPAEAAVALLTSETTDPSAKMSLALNVDTRDSSSNSVTYDISMTKTVTLNSEVTTKNVSFVSGFVTVQIKLRENLANVNVTHSENAMAKCDSLEDLSASKADEGAFYYNPDGTLYIKTMSFSPFAVTYSSSAVAIMDGVEYSSLYAAIAAVPTDGTLKTITLLCDVANAQGFSVASGKNFIVDFAGHTYTVNKPGAGSAGTETNAFQLLKNSTIVFKNGTINLAEDNLTPAVEPAKNIKRIIQNYANLTLDNMAINAENQYDGEAYCLSFNNGASVLKNGTKVITSSDETVAFDSYNWVKGGYESVSVTIEDGVEVNGWIEVGGGVENHLNVATGATVGTVFAESGYTLLSDEVEGYVNYTITK